MVLAPTGRVCKKNARAVRVTTEIRIVIRSAVSAFIRMHPPSPSLLLVDARGLSAASRLLPVVPTAHARRFIVHPFPLFVSFFRTTSLRRRRSASHPGAECDTRRSLVNVEKHDGKKLRVWHRVIAESNFYPCV